MGSWVQFFRSGRHGWEVKWKHVAEAVHIMVDDEAHGEIGWS